MSFAWDQIDARNKQKLERDREVKEFQRRQQEELKSRKIAQKVNDRNEYQNALGGRDQSPIPSMANTFQYGYKSGLSPSPMPPSPIPSNYPPMNYPPPNMNGRPTDVNLSNFMRSPEPIKMGLPDLRNAITNGNSDLPAPMFKTFDPGSSVPYPTPPITDDIISKLRFAEEQLQSERRSRSWLETELQLGKSLVATLTAKVERMQETMMSDSQTIKDLVRQSEQTEKRSVAADQDIVARLEREQSKMQNIIADLTARLRMNEQREDEEAERQKMMVNELNDLRYKVETFSMKTHEVGQEFRAKARDWELESHRGMDFTRMLRDHQMALEGLQHGLDSVSDSTSKKLEMSLLDLRQKIDQEAKSRYHFEGGMRDLFSEVKKAVSSQDRELHDRIEVIKNQIIMAIDRERQDREKTVLLIAEQMRALERNLRDAQQSALDKLASQVAGVEDQFAQERSARGKLEVQCRTDMQDGFKAVQEVVDKKTGEMQQSQQDLKHHVGGVVKALKESVILVEKTADQKLHSLEEVLRAEIKARMELDRNLNELHETLETKVNTVERRAFEAIADAIEESKVTSEKLEESIQAAAEQLASSKSRMMEDLDKQVAQIRTRVKDFETELNSKFRQLQLSAEQIGRDAQQNLENAEAKIEGKIAAAFVNEDELASKIRDVETRCELVKAEMEDKLNIRTLQVDSAFEALKSELDLRSSKKDAADMEVRFEASLANVQASVSKLMEANKEVRDEVELRSTRKELDDMEARSKLLIANLQARAAETDATVIALKEDVSGRGLKKEMEDLESRIKSSILDLQVRDADLDNQIDRVKEDISGRVSREQMTVFEERFRDQIQNTELRSDRIVESVSELRDALALKVTKIELNEYEGRYSDSITALDERINDVNTAVLETRGDLSKAIRDDLEEMVGKINASLEEMQVKIDNYEGSMEAIKIRISDADVASRSRLQQVSDTLQAVIAEHSLSVTGMKELTSQKLEDFSIRLEEMPRQLQAAEQQYEEFRRKLLEFNRSDSEKLNQLLTSMRDSVSQKVSEQEFDRLQSEIRGSVQRILAQQEMEQVTAEQARLRLQEVESASKERYRELKSLQDRAIEEQMLSIRIMKESSAKKLDEMDSRISGLPKSIDQAWMEIRKLHAEVDDRIRADLIKVERDLTLIRGELGARVTEKSMELSIREAVSPVSIKVERIHHDLDDLRFMTDRIKAEVKANAMENTNGNSGYSGKPPPVPVQMGSVPPKRDLLGQDPFRSGQESGPNDGVRGGNYYKPDFARGDGKLPPLGYNQSSERPQYGTIDPPERYPRAESPRTSNPEPSRITYSTDPPPQQNIFRPPNSRENQ
ncbi:hypothetical protein HDU67_005864, partial [Dinochytrium kinnereticum]